MGADHPRSRGVYPSACRALSADGGSSPLARGLQDTCHAAHKSPRIIPARAGFTSSLTICWGSGKDHPRSRGVYPFRIAFRTSGLGSSPLARGLPHAHEEIIITRRIIPARAGFTIIRVSSGSPFGDHPRSRGVYPASSSKLPHVVGSSPLARGLPRIMLSEVIAEGIIPARAGFTGRDGELCLGARDHPRSRGVYWKFSPTQPPTGGSSPLARGLRMTAGLLAGVGGIIPARAGFTP